MKKMYQKYQSKNNIKDYIKKYHLNSDYYSINTIISSYDSTNNSKIKFKIDIEFYKQIYDIKDICPYIHLANYGIENGLIYHPEQLNIILEYEYEYYQKYTKEIYVKLENEYIPIKEFVKQKFDEITVETEFKKYTVKHNVISKYSNVYFLVFIGDYSIGLDIYKKITTSQHYRRGNVGIVFKNDTIYNQFTDIFDMKDNYVIVLKKKDYGNDIIPTLILFNSIRRYLVNKYIIKVHTKSNFKWRNICLQYLIKKSLPELCSLLTDNVLTHPNFLHGIDRFNRKLISVYYDDLDIKKKFAAGSIMFTHYDVFKSSLEFVIKNYQMFFFNIFYDDNLINMNNSPIHFLERLFGMINIEKNRINNVDYKYFNWRKYLNTYKDLQSNKINCKIKAWYHYINYGIHEGRINCIDYN